MNGSSDKDATLRVLKMVWGIHKWKYVWYFTDIVNCINKNFI